MSRRGVTFNSDTKANRAKEVFEPNIIDEDQFNKESFSEHAKESYGISNFIRNHKVAIGVTIIVLIIVLFVIWYKFMRKDDFSKKNPSNKPDKLKDVNEAEDKPSSILKKSPEQVKEQLLKKRQQLKIKRDKIPAAMPVPTRQELIKETKPKPEDNPSESDNESVSSSSSATNDKEAETDSSDSDDFYNNK